MSRLRHSIFAQRRRMQMSSATLFIFIEGRYDRYVYNQIADYVCKELDVSYKVVTADELQEGGGGKPTLLKFFDYLKHRSSLIDRFKGKTTVSIFFLDKDVDDFLRIKRRSEHVVYTKTYELENYLFMFGDIIIATSATAFLDIELVRNGIGDHTAWRQCVALTWKEWVKLCLFSHTRRIPSECSFSQRRSPINNGTYGPVRQTLLANHLSSFQSQLGLPPDKFKRSFKRLSRKVDKLYSTDQHDLVFKGRWYSCFLIEDIKRIARSQILNIRSLEEKLLISLAQSLDFEDGWSEHFKVPIRRLLAKAEI